MESERCKWVTQAGNQCKNNILMDGYCSRHLKQTCAICFEEVKSTNSPNSKRLNCGHSFHMNCVLKWFVTSGDCPVCRKSQAKDPLLEFKDNVEANLRETYKDAIQSLQNEVRNLRRRQNS